MLSEERVKRAIIRLDSSREGRLAREEIEEGVSMREVMHSYDLSFQQIEDLRVVQRALREC
ncbi:hypothetical protein [Halomicrococcus gelatinilyticus]|uniref:hypothetical protein n=1 Tax=Halomicrococcus gelatinilyticus TaxID=1702103 RepID=UPI002E151291